jgi:hypothetical protein
LHETGLSVLVTAAALNATPASFPVEGVLPVVLLVLIPVSLFYQKADTMVRRINIRFFDNARTMLDNGEEACLMGENLKGGALLPDRFRHHLHCILPVMASARYLRPMAEQLAVYPAFAACPVLGSRPESTRSMPRGRFDIHGGRDRGAAVWLAGAMISRGALLKVFLGSFFIQSSWSFEKMQGLVRIGYRPSPERDLQGQKARIEAYKRH